MKHPFFVVFLLISTANLLACGSKTSNEEAEKSLQFSLVVAQKGASIIKAKAIETVRKPTNIALAERIIRSHLKGKTILNQKITPQMVDDVVSLYKSFVKQDDFRKNSAKILEKYGPAFRKEIIRLLKERLFVELDKPLSEE